jgi:polysaccharide deacetylase 2 family uncharacterized protein YibQ
MADELRRPLRRRRIADHLRALRPSPLAAASLTLAAAAIGLAAWLVTAPGPFDGGPVVRVSIAPPDPMITGTAGEPGEEALNAGALPSAQDIAADEALASRTAIVLPRKRPLAPGPVQAVSEAGEFGPLPRVASDGRTPFDVYAQAVPASVLTSGRPKIAIVLGGMGLNANLTRQAMRDLPTAVTLAFAPYGDTVQTLAHEARARGHEVMLNLPMEPFGYPAVDPGPRTLRTGDGAGENPANLSWLMSRFAGYAGVVNYMGARLSGDEASLRPVLAEIGRRGLVYLDDGSSARSVVERLGPEVDLPVRRAQVIDGESFDDIRARLAHLEDEAHRSGVVIGSGAGLSVTIDAVQSWARHLADRGVDLVPASVIFNMPEDAKRTAADGQD